MWMQKRLDCMQFGGLSIQTLDQVQVARSKRANHRMNISTRAPADLPMQERKHCLPGCLPDRVPDRVVESALLLYLTLAALTSNLHHI